MLQGFAYGFFFGFGQEKFGFEHASADEADWLCRVKLLAPGEPDMTSIEDILAGILEPGMTTVELRVQGHQPWTGMVAVEPEKTTDIDMRLQQVE